MKQYLGWRADPAGTASGLSWTRAGLGALLWLAIVPLTLYRFTVGKIAPGLEPWVAFFPVEKKSYYAPVSTWMDGGFDWLSVKGAGVFDGIVAAIRAVLDGLETVFVDTPWPVVMTVIVVVAWRLAGPRVAVFTGAALAYLALFGLWETSMVTVSLLGARRVPLRADRDPAGGSGSARASGPTTRPCRCSTSCRRCRRSST